jgi:hypothetical protein
VASGERTERKKAAGSRITATGIEWHTTLLMPSGSLASSTERSVIRDRMSSTPP